MGGLRFLAGWGGEGARGILRVRPVTPQAGPRGHKRPSAAELVDRNPALRTDSSVVPKAEMACVLNAGNSHTDWMRRRRCAAHPMTTRRQTRLEFDAAAHGQTLNWRFPKTAKRHNKVVWDHKRRTAALVCSDWTGVRVDRPRRRERWYGG